jgi:tetrahydromethanopterin S-methyltransferase subunit A
MGRDVGDEEVSMAVSTCSRMSPITIPCNEAIGCGCNDENLKIAHIIADKVLSLDRGGIQEGNRRSVNFG